MAKYISFRYVYIETYLNISNYYIWQLHLNLHYIFLSLVFLHALLMVVYRGLKESIFCFSKNIIISLEEQ